MHDAKYGELKSGAGGRGGKVESRKQAIAIALHEAGASKYEAPAWARGQPLAVHGWVFSLGTGLITDLNVTVSRP